MNPVTHIAVLYSYGPHFARVVRDLRKRYPHAHLTAITPPDFPDDVLENAADRLQPLAPAPGRSPRLRGILALVRFLRQERFDILVVLFHSPRLSAIAGISGARALYCAGLDGGLRPLRSGLLRPVAARLRRAARGRLLYWRIWLSIRLHPIKASDEDISRNDSA